MSTRNQSVVLIESQYNVINPTNASGALDDGIEHRLHVRGRAANDAEHLRGRRLMLQCLPQFRVGGFQILGLIFNFLKEIDVLDCDTDLIRHGVNQSNFSRC